MSKTNQFTCLNCGSQEPPKEFLKNCADLYLRMPVTVDYFTCSECGLVQVSPIPGDVSSYYAAYPVHANKSKLHSLLRRIVMSSSYFDSSLAAKDAVLLDFGCGDGWFLESSRKHKLSLVGFEPSPQLAEDLSIRLKLPIYSDPKRLVSAFASRVDYMTMHFVMEHVTDLKGTFALARELLRGGGIFFFTVPNIDSWEAKLFGRKWHGLDAPRHISFPNKRVVEELGQSHGLELTRVGFVPFPNGVAGSIPSVIIGHFNQVLYSLALPLGILVSRLAPSGVSAYTLQKRS